MTEDKVVGWRHQLGGHEFEQAPGQGSLAYCSPWGHKESDTTEQLSLPVVTYGCESWTMKRLSAEELMLLNCGDGEDC